MEVNKDQGTSNTVKDTSAEAAEGAPATPNSNDIARERMNVNKDQRTLHTSINVEGTVVEANQEAAANSNTDDRVSAASDSEHCIFKVHNQLRNVNTKAYEPEIIAIGPYHRAKISHLQLMETHKLRFQEVMLERRNEEISIYLEAIKPHEEKARQSYAEPTAHIPSEEFVKMLVLDGIFIIEFLCMFDKFSMANKSDGPIDAEVKNIRNDPIFKMPWALKLLQRDLMLFENQLPFFILAILYGMITPASNLLDFILLAVSFFNDLYPGKGTRRKSSDTTTHEGDGFDPLSIKHFLELIHMFWGSQKVTQNVRYKLDSLELMGCSTNLREAGIRFQKIEKQVCFDIEFRNGVLRVPVFTMDDTTDSFLRNLIAFEQYCGDSRFHIVTDYMTFFSCLIKSEKDVDRLVKLGILRSYVSDHEVVSNMFKTITETTTGPSANFHYAQIFRRVNKHCRKPQNRCMAILKRDHMNNPWKIISILSVSALLLLTVLQVAFQILSWQNQILSWKSQNKVSE